LSDAAMKNISARRSRLRSFAEAKYDVNMVGVRVLRKKIKG